MTEVREGERTESLEEFAIGHLEQGRKGWDVAHTRSVVYYGSELARAVELDDQILEAAAYLHDIGYPPISENQSRAITEQKAYHMVRGAQLAREFLERPENLTHYTPQQRELIIRLVASHDNLRELDVDDLYAVVMVEADTLGMLDFDRATPTLSREDGLRFVASVEQRRAPLFQTELGKQLLAGILPKAREYFLKLPDSNNL